MPVPCVARMLPMVILAASLAGASGASVCDLTQCQCLLSLWGTEVACQCEEHEELTLSPLDLPESVHSLSVVGCASLGLSGSLAGLPLRELTVKGVKNLRIPAHAFLGGLEHITTVTIEDSSISALPSFSFSALDNVFSILFNRVQIDTISSDAFSDLMHLRHLRFVKCDIGKIERNAFGRGTSKIANFVFDECEIGTIQERGIWLDDSEIVQIDKSNIEKITLSGIKLNNAFFFYLTRSAVRHYEAGGIEGRIFSGVMIDNNFLNPLSVDPNDPRPLFELTDSRLRGSSVPPFFHLTNNVITRTVPSHAFFVTNPTINVAVPNNTLGDCSCTHYRNFLLSLRPLLDEYTLTVHQALVEHGLCLIGDKIYSIGCPHLAPPAFSVTSPKNILIPSRELALRISKETAAKVSRTTTEKPPRIMETTPNALSRRPTSRPATKPDERVTRPPLTTIATTTTAKKSTVATITESASKPFTRTDNLQTKTNNTKSIFKTNEDVIPVSKNVPTESKLVTSPKAGNGSSSVVGQILSSAGKGLNGLDLQTIWNEIYGGVFSLRLRKPLPKSFPRREPGIKFSRIVKPIELHRFHGGKLAFSPR
ncbi:uncharacterized protein LOC122268179 [Penaeus japonicus]|uniref:uncharacterized protein LOC122268179 n=1 Tax=Penaeus japonicus TaxID=27405 RepID=UPI001C712019|nr:uncharacterized protein LOC122268179 [Penaeus japonicus]